MVPGIAALKDLREQCGALAAALARFEHEQDPNVQSVHALLALCHRRARVFAGCGLQFDDPSWLVLLDLYVRPVRSVSISSACIASLAPPTTALRHIGQMVKAGLLDRVPSPTDRRMSYLSLTPAAIAAIEATVAA